MARFNVDSGAVWLSSALTPTDQAALQMESSGPPMEIWQKGAPNSMPFSQFKTVLLVFLVHGVLLGNAGCYSLQQVYHQGNLLATRKPIRVLIWDPKTPKELRRSLKTVERIREFARRRGLNVGGAYATYIQSPYSAVSFLVQAADPIELKLKHWHFPIVGAVPYLGYFHPENRDAKAKQLRAMGLDVATGVAGAFSSLGWYDDPIYSPMLRRRESQLAHLIFHEVTHRTFWIPGEATLNEHMAEFVAITITRLYLKEYGLLKELQEYDAGLEDRKLYTTWLKSLRADLKSLYSGVTSRAHKLAQKQAIFTTYLSQKLPKFVSSRYGYLAKRTWNNAVLMGASLYQPETAPFERAYQCRRYTSEGMFLKSLEKQFDRTDVPAAKILESLCAPGKVGRLEAPWKNFNNL